MSSPLRRNGPSRLPRPLTRASELNEHLASLRAACEGANDPALEGALARLASHALEADAPSEAVERAWRALVRDANGALIEMKKRLADQIRDGSEPPGARERLRGFHAALEALKKGRMQGGG